MNAILKTKKYIFLTLACSFSLTLPGIRCYAQGLPDFHPGKGYTQVAETHGDLDKDGTEEVAYAYNTTHRAKDSGYKRVLYICKNIQGKLKLWKVNSSVLWNSEDCGFFANEGVPLEMEIKNNTLRIKQTFNHNAKHFSIWNNIFRYQNGDWFLIGSTYNDSMNCGPDHQCDINFSTKTVEVSTTYDRCDDDEKPDPEPSSANFTYPFKEIPRMDGFTPGRKEIKVTGTRYIYY